MSSPAITVDEDESITEIAQIMKQANIGCVIVTGRDGKPLGMITERDLVVRVLARKAIANQLSAKEVMSTPLIVVNPEETINEAARRMSQRHIRRLGILYKGDLVGIISSKDILAVTPDLLEIIQEKARINAIPEEDLETPPLVGYCEQCARWSDALKGVDGNFLCEECRLEFEVEY
jgi:predicted transcriptional regulator